MNNETTKTAEEIAAEQKAAVEQTAQAINDTPAEPTPETDPVKEQPEDCEGWWKKHGRLVKRTGLITTIVGAVGIGVYFGIKFFGAKDEEATEEAAEA